MGTELAVSVEYMIVRVQFSLSFWERVGEGITNRAIFITDVIDIEPSKELDLGDLIDNVANGGRKFVFPESMTWNVKYFCFGGMNC